MKERRNAIGHLTIEELSPDLLQDIREIAVEEAGNESAGTTTFDGTKYQEGHIMAGVDDVQEAIDKLTDLVDNTANETEDGLMSKEDKVKLNDLNINNQGEGEFLWSADRILQEIAKLRVSKQVIEIPVVQPGQKEFEITSPDYNERTCSLEVRIGGVPFNEKRYTMQGNRIVLNPEERGIDQGRKIVVVIYYIAK